MALDPDCIFCKIIEGVIPADIIFRNENVVAFNDLNPQAPTHVLLIPTLHTENAAGVARNSAIMHHGFSIGLKGVSGDADIT